MAIREAKKTTRHIHNLTKQNIITNNHMTAV